VALVVVEDVKRCLLLVWGKLLGEVVHKRGRDRANGVTNTAVEGRTVGVGANRVIAEAASTPMLFIGGRDPNRHGMNLALVNRGMSLALVN